MWSCERERAAAKAAHKRFGGAKTLPQGQFICPKEVKTRGPWPAEAGWGGTSPRTGINIWSWRTSL